MTSGFVFVRLFDVVVFVIFVGAFVNDACAAAAVAIAELSAAFSLSANRAASASSFLRDARFGRVDFAFAAGSGAAMFRGFVCVRLRPPVRFTGASATASVFVCVRVCV
jgi:hypothetical protein